MAAAATAGHFKENFSGGGSGISIGRILSRGAFLEHSEEENSWPRNLQY